MKRALIIPVALLLLAGGWIAYEFIADRAPPHRFVVRLDEPAKLARLTLGNSETEPHIVEIKNRTCPEIGAHVQL